MKVSYSLLALLSIAVLLSISFGCESDLSTSADSSHTSHTSHTLDSSTPTELHDSSDMSLVTQEDVTQEDVLGIPQFDVDIRRPVDELSMMSLVMWHANQKQFIYGQGVIPYEISMPLFSDYTLKDRAVYVPPEGMVELNEAGLLILPYGSATIKSFSYNDPSKSDGRRVLETRLMFFGQRGWSAWPYVWDEEALEANLSLSGAILEQNNLTLSGETVSFTYVVPQRNQCIDCHEVKKEGQREITPIGIKLRNLSPASFEEDGLIQVLINRGQLDPNAVDRILSRQRSQVLFSDVKTKGVDHLTPLEVDHAARDYLDMNCAHCHNPQGAEGVSSQLFLDWDASDAFNLGVCKKPGSAGKGTFGLDYDIVPGSPEQSILWRRMDTENIGAMMPDFGRSFRHQLGVDLVYRWIEQLEGSCNISKD